MQKGKNWVDYNEIKERITIEQVLRHYGIMEHLKVSGKNLVGCCPIHKGKNHRQFSVSLEKNAFNCFGNCKSGGNIIDFVSKIEKVEIREAAIMIKKWFLNNTDQKEEENKKEPEQEKKPEIKKGPVNPTLTFKLQNLDPKYKFFDDKGIEPETVKEFGLGFCSRGILKGRIAIPIHDEKGTLVAYCGRAVTDEQKEKDGKYKLPAKFVKSAVVYNLNNQKSKQDLFILVESYLSVWRLYQAGFNNVIALMGSDLSEKQEELIKNALGPDGRLILLFDDDESGHECEQACIKAFSGKFFVKAIDISPYSKKPHHLSTEELEKLLLN